MSDMLGRSGPWEYRCCTKHSGRYRKSGKRRVEEKQWREEAQDQMEDEPDRRAGPVC